MSGLFHKPKAPETPDFQALAKQQAEANQAAALQTAKLGSPNEVTPWGSITREYDPQTGQFTYTTTLTPEQEALFKGGEQIDLSRMELGKTMIGNLSDLWSQPFDTSGMTERITSVTPTQFRADVPTREVQGTSYQLDPGAAPAYQKTVDFSGLGDRPTLDFSNLPQMPGVGDFGAERQRVEDALYQQQVQRLDPEWQQREQQLRNRLYSQGIREGHPAWTQAFEDFNRQRNAAYESARLAAITGAGQEQSRLFGMASAARSQLAQEALASAGFQLDARAQGVAEALAEGNFANAVTQLERQYGLDRQAAINMAAQLQNQFELAASQQGFQQDLAAAQLHNLAASESFDQQLANAMLASQSRASELDEAAFLRALPFQELSAILQGTDVTMPQFSGPTVAPGVQAAPIYQAGQDAYQAAWNKYAQEMQRLNALWSAIGEVGGQIGAAVASDARLKRNIRRMGSLPSGLGIYAYEIFGRPEIGVLAQEAAEVFPDAVLREPITGYLMVDYARIR